MYEKMRHDAMTKHKENIENFQKTVQGEHEPSSEDWIGMCETFMSDFNEVYFLLCKAENEEYGEYQAQ